MGNIASNTKADFMSTLCCKHWISQKTSDFNGVDEEHYKYRDSGRFTVPIPEEECQVCNYLIKKVSQTTGFIIVDGNGALLGQLCEGEKTILFEFKYDMPRKMGRGGMSALRFARLRLEKRQKFVNRVIIESNKYFYDNCVPNVSKIIIGCSAEFKNMFSEIKTIGSKLKIEQIVDIAYGRLAGFNQAIETLI